jgi:hypothetical protein
MHVRAASVIADASARHRGKGVRAGPSIRSVPIPTDNWSLDDGCMVNIRENGALARESGSVVGTGCNPALIISKH